MEYWKVCTKEPNLRIALRKIGLSDNDPNFTEICRSICTNFNNQKHVYVVKHNDKYFCSNQKMGKHITNYLKVTDKEIEQDFYIQLNQNSHKFYDKS